MKYIKLNENIALAKSILRKNGIAEDNEDYLKIREMVGTAFSYVGILTRLRFVDNVTDMEELKSIFEVLKNSKLDLGKLNKMSYGQILDTFYDQMTSTSKEDYELIYKDNSYSFFRVYTYKGILEIGSPAWCLKTKSHWDDYQSKFPEQWVAIDNRYVKNIVTPNNNYFTNAYRNTSKTWVRFGISFKRNADGTTNWLAHDDNDGKCELKPDNHTFYGVLFTTLNLSYGNKKSFYQRFTDDLEYVKDGILKIIPGQDYVWKRLGVKPPQNTNEGDENYLFLSKSYSFVPIVLRIRERSFPCLRIFNNNRKVMHLFSMDADGFATKALNDYVQKPQNVSYSGIRLKLGLTTVDELKKDEDFVLQVGKWLVFHWNKDYFIAIDSEPGEYVLPVMDLAGNEYWTNHDSERELLPMFYYIDKEKISNSEVKLDTPESKEILRQLSGKKPTPEPEPERPQEEEKPGFIKRFFGFK
jgi:hypothetical protein